MLLFNFKEKTMQELIFLLHVLAAVCLIALILMQRGKGADMGAAFGAGASQTMFGSIGAMPFLVKVTGVLAAIFFATSLVLSYFNAKLVKQGAQVVAPTEQVPAPVKK
jgi:preprotein translocase subunit SecG